VSSGADPEALIEEDAELEDVRSERAVALARHHLWRRHPPVLTVALTGMEGKADDESILKRRVGIIDDSALKVDEIVAEGHARAQRPDVVHVRGGLDVTIRDL
jgi:hypothetical protein